MSKKVHYTKLKHFTVHEKKLSIFFDGYSSVISEAEYKKVHGEGLKILTLEHMP